MTRSAAQSGQPLLFAKFTMPDRCPIPAAQGQHDQKVALWAVNERLGLLSLPSWLG